MNFERDRTGGKKGPSPEEAVCRLSGPIRRQRSGGLRIAHRTVVRIALLDTAIRVRVPRIPPDSGILRLLCHTLTERGLPAKLF